MEHDNGPFGPCLGMLRYRKENDTQDDEQCGNFVQWILHTTSSSYYDL